MNADWRDLYEREYPRLVRALLALGGDRESAEDAAQEAFVKAQRHGLARLERPGAWLLVVGTRELFRSRRHRRREAEAWPDGAVESGAGYEAAIERADLVAALRQLPERQRAIVVARFYYDLSYADIARSFAISSGTVGATLNQAISRLRQLHLGARLARGAMR
ncbi:MAG: RNA polymerase sigma factor [Candidatus Limnocylindria bacterium]